MTEIFETFRPKDAVIARYVDYYYLDLKPQSKVAKFRCFPHYNTAISLYRSHHWRKDGAKVYDKQAGPLQIFTPVREKILDVIQIGKVHRVVIVFHPLGVQQFYRNLDYAAYVKDFAFFHEHELSCLFQSTDPASLTEYLDQMLRKRYVPFEHPLLTEALHRILDGEEAFSVAKLADRLGMSRRHLNRLFQQNLGVSIKKFQTIVRFRKALDRRLFTDPEESFTELAYALNFSDQAHFNKTFEKLTRHAPRQFFRKGTLLGREDTFWHLA